MRLVPSDDLLAAAAAALRRRAVPTGVIPARSYPGQEADVPTVGSATLLVVDEKMSEALAYEITRAVFEHTAELAAIHPVARTFSPERAAVGSPAPFHPGRDPLLPRAGQLAVVTAPEPLAAQVLEAYEPEAATRTLRGPAGWLARALSVGLAVYGLYWVVAILDAHVYRTSFLAHGAGRQLPPVPGAPEGARRPGVAPGLAAGGARWALRWAGRSSTAPRSPTDPPPRPRRTSCWDRWPSSSCSRRRGAPRAGSSPSPPRSSSSTRTSARCSTSSA